MEVLSRDRELTILVDSESQRDIEQTVDDIKDIRANIALNVDGRNVDLPKDVSVIVTTVLESLSKGAHHRFLLNDVLEYRDKQQEIKREHFLAVRGSLDELED